VDRSVRHDINKRKAVEVMLLGWIVSCRRCT